MKKTDKLWQKSEKLITKECFCPKCKNENTLKLLPPNFKCADIICDFCGYLAQVKTKKVKDICNIPNSILGAAWMPQKERMQSGIYFPLYLILVNSENEDNLAIYYLSADLQNSEIYKPRNKLSKNAKRAGWQGFVCDFSNSKDRFVRLL